MATNAHASRVLECDAKASEGWIGRLYLELDVRAGRTVLARKRQVGPLAVQRAFYPEGSACHLYLLHPPGGVVGGDRLEIRLDVASGAHALVTAPGAIKFYRSAGATAFVQQRLIVGDGGLLEWLPEESILFPGAQVHTQTIVELAPEARFAGWEIFSLGRPVINERFDCGAARFDLSLHRTGRPVLREHLRISNGRGLDGPSGLRGFPVCGTFIATGAGPQDLNVARKAVAEETGVPIGLTLIEDMLIGRCLASSVESAKRIFRSFWVILRPRLMGRDACPPRIWST